MKKQNVSFFANFFILSVTIIIIIVDLGINIPYRKNLFQYSLIITHEMQQRIKNNILTIFQNLITMYAGTQGTFLLLILSYICCFDKINMIVTVMYISTNAYIMALVKVAFLDPRPYIYPQLVQLLQWNCQPTYGFPSGHAWILLLLHQPLVTDFIGLGPYKILLFYPIALGILVPWSRIYLGSHSLDQLIIGMVYSLAFLVLYRFYFRKKLFNFISYLLQRKNRKHQLLKFVLLITINLTFIVFPIILYKVNLNYRDINLKQFDLTKKMCNKNFNLQQKIALQLSDCAIGNLFMGFSYALLFIGKSYGNQQNSIKNVRFLLGYWQFNQQNRCHNLLIKIFLYILSVLLTAGITYYLIQLLIEQFYLSYFFKILAWIFMTFVWIILIPEISIRYNLITQRKQEQEFQYENNQILKNNNNELFEQN